jgi:tetratricopeptide (TPR) repeat protein
MARRKAPENPDVLTEFGWLCMKKDLIDDAAAFDKALEIRPGHPSTTYMRASAHVGKKQYEEASRLLEKLLEKHSDDAALNYAIGPVLYLAVRLDEAEKYLRKSIALDPNQAASHHYFGLVLGGQAREDQSIQVLQESTSRFPQYAPTYEALGTILFKIGKHAEAQKALERAIEINRNHCRRVHLRNPRHPIGLPL